MRLTNQFAGTVTTTPVEKEDRVEFGLAKNRWTVGPDGKYGYDPAESILCWVVAKNGAAKQALSLQKGDKAFVQGSWVKAQVGKDGRPSLRMGADLVMISPSEVEEVAD